MERRDFLAAGIASNLVLIAGCGSDSDSSSNPTPAPDVDTGVVYDGNVSNIRIWQVEVMQGQTVTVEALNVEEGEYLWFQVGGRTDFVYSYRIYEQDSGTPIEYQFEGDGQHSRALQLTPIRDEAPFNEEVTVSVTMELSEP